MRSKLTLTPLRVVIFFVFLCVRVNAAEWIDVTDAFVTNPRFEGNTKDGWTVYPGASYGGYNVNYNAMEMWYAYFRVGQELSGLPSGKYRLSVNAYYRPGGFDSSAAENYSEATAKRDAYIWANDKQTPVQSVYSQFSTTRINGGDNQIRVGGVNRYYPNNMEGASARFSTGAYPNSLELDVTDGTLNFGMACPDDGAGQRIAENWTIWSNWKLEFYGDMQPVTAITFSPASYRMTRFNSRKLTPTVQPSTATIQKLKWESSDEKVATVDQNGNVTAHWVGSATITASALDGSGVSGSCTVRVSQTSVTSVTFVDHAPIIEKGQQVALSVVVLPATATDPSLSWWSSDESVATVDEAGIITGVEAGQCIITATSCDGTNKSDQCTLIVTSHPATKDNLFINEIQSRNVDMFIDPSFNYGGWIEFYNPTAQPADLGGVIIRDDLRGYETRLPMDYGSVPAGGYRNVWFDHYDGQYGKLAYKQVDWKLDTDGGTVSVLSREGELLATQTFPSLKGRTSYARKTDGTGAWAVTAEPTPEAGNATSTFVTTQISGPTVDRQSGLFTSPFTFTVTYPSDATLVYTTDGSTPTLSNGTRKQGGGFSAQVNATSIYRFRLFKTGMIPSEVVTRSWIYNDNDYELPLVIVNTAPENLYDDEIGIYTKGSNGRSGNGVTGTDKANWNMDWERPVNFEYIDANRDINFSQEVDMSISGGWSRMWGMTYSNLLSFKLKATKTYGLNDLSQQWFEAKPYNKYKQLMLRNGGNDRYNQSRCKDNMLQQIIIRSGIYCDAQETSPSHVFLNGEFKGTMNIREVTNRQYGYSNYGLDTDLQDAFEMSVDSGYVQTTGDSLLFDEWYKISSTAYDEHSWNRIVDIVDIDEFCNYFAVQLYTNNWDWPHNNLKAFRDKSAGGKFHFVIFDLDNCFDRSFNPFTDFENQRIYTFYTIYNEDGSSYRITEEVKMVTIFLNMLQNAEFRKKFIDTYCLVAGSVFEPGRCAEIIEEFRSRMASLMQKESWYNVWFVNQHADNLLNAMTSDMQTRQVSLMANYLSATGALTASLSSNIGAGQLQVNGIPVPTDKFSGRLFYPVKVKAIAPASYRFLGWMDVDGSSESTMLFPMNATWQYYDQGDLTGTDWKTSGSQVSWRSGGGLFGFHSRDDGAVIVTTLDWGSNPNQKRPTYYFRKTCNLAMTPDAGDVFKMTVNFDDGYIIYVNGQEVARKRLNSGAAYTDYASAYGSDPYDTDVINIAASYFKKGENVIAVEVHNQSGTSSDVYFDASLQQNYSGEGGGGQIVNTDPEMELEASGNYNLKAVWEPLTDEEKKEEGLPTAPIVINEVSAGNSIYINDFFKKDDWIELYNTTDEDIDLAGLCITDRRDNPAKWQITTATKSDPSVHSKASTIIPAHGYKLIWCGDRYKNITAENTQLHANFKLSNSATEPLYVAIGKYDTDKKQYEWVDSLPYRVMNGDQTVGRFPDGGTQTYLMSLPTIDKQNTITSYAKEYIIPVDPTGINSLAEEGGDRSGSLSVRYYGGNLYISSEEAGSVTVSIYGMSGALLDRRQISVSGGHAVMNVSGMTDGLYVARVMADGEECAVKFLK